MRAQKTREGVGMHRKVTKSWLRVSVALLAACLSGAPITQAAGKSAQAGDVAEAPAKAVKHDKHAKSKKQDKRAVKASQKDQAGSVDEIDQLKKQLALQQEQIAQLLQAMNRLEAQVTATAHSTTAAPVAQPAPNLAAAAASISQAAPQFPSAGEVASLSPVVPIDSAATETGSASKISPGILPNASSAAVPVPAQAEKNEKLGPIATQNIKLGATFYGNFSHYNETGFVPAFQDLTTTHVGPGNDGLNKIGRAHV